MLYDRATISGPARITRDGYFVADALVARANNIQTYTAAELGLTDRAATDKVRVFRPEAEVFSKDALASLAHRPITLDHPADPVNATNWRDLAVGDVGDEIVRDGEFVRVPLKVMDAAAIDSIKSDRREFSLGYQLTLDTTPGEFNGEAYDAVARDIRYNHLAAVRRARGGQDLRIIDERTQPKEPPMKIKIGDAEVDATNGEAVRIAVDALNTKLTDADKRAADAEAKVVEHTATITAKDEKIAELEKQVADSAITPAKLADAAKEFADVQAKAKALGVTVAADADTAAIKKAVVEAKMGDAAKDYSDEHIAIAFDALTKDAKIDDADKIHDIGRVKANDDDLKVVADAYDEMVKNLTDRQPAKAA